MYGFVIVCDLSMYVLICMDLLLYVIYLYMFFGFVIVCDLSIYVLICMDLLLYVIYLYMFLYVWICYCM